MVMVASHATRWIPSSKANPCPVCGRTKDGDCRISGDGLQVNCHRGSTHSPPADLKKGDTVIDKDGRVWAYTHDNDRGAHFTIHKPRGQKEKPTSGKVVQFRPKKPAPAPIKGPMVLAELATPWPPAPPSHLEDGLMLHYSEHQWTEWRNRTDKDGSRQRGERPRHRHDGEVQFNAGTDPWPLFGNELISQAKGKWIAAAEGPKCAMWLQAGGVVGVSQPGHDHKDVSITRRFRELVEAGVGGVAYLNDNDETGDKKGRQLSECAAEAGLPFLQIPAIDVWPDLPVGGSIDDAPGTAEERVSAITAAITKSPLTVFPSTGIKAVLEAIGEGWHTNKYGEQMRSALAMGDLSKKLEKLGNRLAFDQLALRPAVDQVVLPSHDIELLHAALSEQGWRIGKASATDGLMLATRRHQFHPIREYLNGVADNPGVQAFDLDSVASKFFRTTDPLHAAMVRKWLIGAVARAMQPGCKMDYCLVAQSDQGVGKSTFFETLASPEWFCSTIPDDDKDLTLNIHNCWLFELAELEAVTGKREAGRLKNLMTTARDLVRVPYGTVPERLPRPSAFCATVNRRDFLRDDTGNRRFWIVPINGQTKIDSKAIAAARDGIWKAAVLAWRSNETPVLTEEQVERSEAQNLDFRELDPWFETVRAFAEVKANEGLVPIQLEDVLERLEIPVQNRNNTFSRRVRDLLEEAGWQYGRRRTDLGQFRGFWPPTN